MSVANTKKKSRILSTGLIPLEISRPKVAAATASRQGGSLTGLIDSITTPTAVGCYGASEVRVYNRALSPDEIKRLYNMGR